MAHASMYEMLSLDYFRHGEKINGRNDFTRYLVYNVICCPLILKRLRI